MAKIKIDGFLEELEVELKKTIEATMRLHFDEGSYNSKEIFKSFKKEMIERCNSWESIPNKFVRNN